MKLNCAKIILCLLGTDFSIQSELQMRYTQISFTNYCQFSFSTYEFLWAILLLKSNLRFSWICSQKSSVFQNTMGCVQCGNVLNRTEQKKKNKIIYQRWIYVTESNTAYMILKRVSGKSLGALWFNQVFPFLWEILALVLISRALVN